MRQPPVEVLLSWPKPNYVNPETRGPALIILNSVFLGIATVFLALRAYTRLFVKKFLGWDDFFILLAYLCTVALNATADIGATSLGWNRHIWDIPLKTIESSRKMAYIAKIMFLGATFFTVCSLLAFYYRIIAQSHAGWFRWALHAAVILNIASFLPFFLLQVFVCTPVPAYWTTPQPVGSKCIEESIITMVGGITKTVVDFVVTTLPLPLILRTNMLKRQKYMVSILFALGYIVTTAGAIRCYYTWKVFYRTYDMTWYQYPAFLAATVENNLAIICACAPTIRPLFPHLFGGPINRFRGWWSSQSQRSNEKNTWDKSDSRPTNCSSKLAQYGSHLRFSRNQFPYQQHQQRPFPAQGSSDLKLCWPSGEDAMEPGEWPMSGATLGKEKSIEDIEMRMLDEKLASSGEVSAAREPINTYGHRPDGHARSVDVLVAAHGKAFYRDEVRGPR